ncbi:hypothetical protein BJ988_003652 [Nocardioides panzhihuensis]|uniref:Uncharacterized protein n=1 Tax=Nocardioides panzhihuensis TaxID=860243 RepID=A0A7Z0DNP6_9ACTN|nr:hypothetical protein [Nocardioides panzhihuensis]
MNIGSFRQMVDAVSASATDARVQQLVSRYDDGAASESRLVEDPDFIEALTRCYESVVLDARRRGVDGPAVLGRLYDSQDV